MAKPNDSFYSLSPDRVLNSVESVLQREYPGLRTTGKTMALNSLENRVFEIEIEQKIHGETSVVAKFYRPGRWTRSQIAEEHAFTRALADAELPVVTPLLNLAETDDGIFFAVFPKLRGRLKDELNEDELRHLGRFLGQLHAVGSNFHSQHRVHLDVQTYGARPLAALLQSPFLDDVSRPRYAAICRDLFPLIERRLENVQVHLLHGDCHVGNILWNETGPFFVDFDDAVVGPPAQDLWMIVKGRGAEDQRLREELLAGYEMMRDFDRSSLALIEPLRALRLIHYSAWIAKRWSDPSFPKMFTQFTTQRYWFDEIEALHEIYEIISRGEDLTES